MKAIITLLITLSLSCSLNALENASKPNIILIYADDLGIGMLGCYGQKVISTPNIDQLADEGVKFNNYYGGVFCAPSRWSLLTGMHDARLGGWQHTGSGLLMRLGKKDTPQDKIQKALDEYVELESSPIPENEVFLAQVAQQAGYKTAQFGKLDVGFLTNHKRVKRFGWDYYEGYYSHSRCHGFYPPYLWRNGERFELEGNTLHNCGKMSERGNEPVGSGGETYSQNVFIDGILKFIRQHKDEPFFLYHSTQLPHGPVAIPTLHPDFIDDENLSLAEKKYASMIKMLDDHVGLIMKELKTQGLDENTVVAFTSDNGHELYYGPKSTIYKKRANGNKANFTGDKWRTSEDGDVFNGAGGRAGVKRAVYQGGLQCPMIVRWPGKIKAGGETELLSSHYDFLATIAEIGGVKAPTGKDSISYLPTLLGTEQDEKHDYVIVNNNTNRMGRSTIITKDGWKLIELDREQNQFQLYNIKDDNEERHNLEEKNPEIAERLKKQLLSELDSERPDLSSK